MSFSLPLWICCTGISSTKQVVGIFWVFGFWFGSFWFLVLILVVENVFIKLKD